MDKEGGVSHMTLTCQYDYMVNSMKLLIDYDSDGDDGDDGNGDDEDSDTSQTKANNFEQEKEDEVDLMFADIEPEDEWQDKVRCLILWKKIL